MATERECWFNIYPKVYGDRQIGLPHWTKAAADKALKGRRRTVECRDTPAFRVHVRLKPEGAPRRYADHLERYAWERDPGFVRALDRLIAGDPAPPFPRRLRRALRA